MNHSVELLQNIIIALYDTLDGLEKQCYSLALSKCLSASSSLQILVSMRKNLEGGNLLELAQKFVYSILNRLQEISIHRSPNCYSFSNISLDSISFANICGYNVAKQLLYENIILPFTLPLCVRQTIFQGIRSRLGNIILFGPPGCGMTN